MPPSHRVSPKTFYLNEQHELSRGEAPGGGRTPEFVGIDWAAKGRSIFESLETVKAQISASKDPLRAQHYFVLATPVQEIQKRSKDQKKAPDGILSQGVRFDEEDSRVFRRLGLDLVDVTPKGEAIVHMRPDRLEQLASTAAGLERIGAREKTRWASIDMFGLIPPDLRLDRSWVDSLRPRHSTDAVVEFQPLLARSEVGVLLQTINGLLRNDRQEALTGLGTDYSGRHWVRGKITPESLKAIARMFYSVQTLHSPLLSRAAMATRSSRPATSVSTRRGPIRPADVSTFPTVAVLDTGVPADHSILATYRRGAFISPDSYGSPIGDHGSFVASRVVFGDSDFGNDPPVTPAGTCRYYDVLVAVDYQDIDNKGISRAVEAVVGTAPDVRVFNFSFDTAPLDQLDPIKQHENLLLVQDLDNLIFQHDLMVIISAGNSPPGAQSSTPYPMNYDDPQWQLGAWARSFNSLTCGSFVNRLTPGALVTTRGWPSPFCRVGPGLCDSPKPDFSAPGGNSTQTMGNSPGLGVWGLTSAAMWEDRAGTSFAAPVLAREVAFTMHSLQRVCQQGARPYGVTARAFLVLTATAANVSGAAAELAKRSLGRGAADHRRLEHPVPESAVMLWQGILEGPGDIARIKLPIPRAWYDVAASPTLRIVVCWDPPVNAAVRGLWATRKVTAHIKVNPKEPSLHGTRGGNGAYPMIDRKYDLRRLPKDVAVEGDIWLIELSYSQIADYHSAITFNPQQRVAFAAEIYDDSDAPESPQSAVQALPAALTMTRLSVQARPIAPPVVVRPIT
jgi:hypothetical protein